MRWIIGIALLFVCCTSDDARAIVFIVDQNHPAVLDAPNIYRAPWTHVFAIDHDDNGNPVEFHPDDEPLWGRAEQVTVDDTLLLPVKDLAALKAIEGDPNPPIAHLGGPFAGWFCVDSATQSLYVRLADGSDPTSHKVEAATRDLLFGTTPFINEKGVSNIHVRGFTFRDGATFPQRAGVSLHGTNNLLEDCIIERMAGTGVSVSGTMRRCIVRNNGHTGGGASDDGFVNEDCTWEGNSWKPISRGWEAGGMKIVDCAGGLYRRCTFRRNGGPGLWLDVNVRDVLITECVFAENETSGLFIEISRDITVINNLAVRNGVDVIGKLDGDAWSVAGIQIAESMNCLIANNTCAGNRDGITLREQGPRTIPTADGDVDFHNVGHTIVGNVLANNEGFQLAFWYDSEKYAIAKQGFLIDRNLYHREGNGALVLFGASWRDGSQEFSMLDAFTAFTHFETLGRAADPVFVDPTNDFRFKLKSPAREMNAGWNTPPSPSEE